MRVLSTFVLLYHIPLFYELFLLLSYILLLFSTLKMFQNPSIYAGFQRFWFAQIQSRLIKYMVSVFCPNWTHWVRGEILKKSQKPSVYAGFRHFSQ